MVHLSAAARDQAAPASGRLEVLTAILPTIYEHPDGHAIVKDLVERSERGLEKYGTRLQTHNGRSADLDLYQELCDAVMYSGQAMLESTTPTYRNLRLRELLLLLELAFTVRLRLVSSGILS